MAHSLNQTPNLAELFQELEQITLQSLQLHSLLANSLSMPSNSSTSVARNTPRNYRTISVTQPQLSDHFSSTQAPEVQAKPKVTYFRKSAGIYHPILKA